MTRRLFADLLVVVTVLASALCIARGFLTGFSDPFFQAALAALLGGLTRFVLGREMPTQE